MTKTVIALYESAVQAQEAAKVLRSRGLAIERLQVTKGADLLAMSRVPPMEKEQRGLWAGVKTFVAELGLSTPDAPPEADYRPLRPDDTVVLVETAEDRANAAAAVLNEYGAIDVQTRRRADGADSDHLASGLEAKVGGRIPPETEGMDRYQDIDERALVNRRPPPAAPGAARIY